MYYLIAVGCILMLWYLSTYVKWRREIYYYMEQIPGPGRLPLVGTLHHICGVKRSDIFRAFKFVTAQYRPFFRTWNGSLPEIHIMKPEHLEIIMNNSVHITKGSVYDYVKPWLGEGLLLSTGAKWHQRRRMITPTFHFKILENFIEVFVDKSKLLAKEFEKKTDGQHFDVYPYITRCALDIICETAMGVQVNAMSKTNNSYLKAINEASELIVRRTLTPWLQSRFYYSFPEGKAFQGNLDTLHGFTNKVILERKKALKDNPKKTTVSTDDTRKTRMSFLDLFLDAAKTNKSITDSDIREEVDTFMFEGHDTTTAAMCWSIFLLANHPSIQEKVYQEVKNVLQDRKTPESIADLCELKYLECCVKEALRLYPSVPIIVRQLAEDIVIDGYKVPKGVHCVMHIHEVHRDPEMYPEPEKFDPDRFLSENCVKRHPYAYVPFSAGSRNCIGQKFALYEEKTVLATIIRSFKIKPVDTIETINVISELILKPEHGLKICLENRED